MLRSVKKILDYLFSLYCQTLPSHKYWKQRVRLYGRRAVLDIRHPGDEFKFVTDRQKKEIFPYLHESLIGDEKVILDLGCGPGRFTGDLASVINGKAIGVDLISELIEMAPRDENVEYKIMVEGRIPLPDNHVDVVWICLVLGGIIRQSTLRQTLDEIKRVLRPDGLLFLVENTSDMPSGRHWMFRHFEEYREMFSFAPLTHLHDYFDFGERFSIMAGRKLK